MCRRPRISRSEPLFDVLEELDKLVSPAAPVDTAVWMAALAAPLIAERLQSPQTSQSPEPDRDLDAALASGLTDESLPPGHGDPAADDESPWSQEEPSALLGDSSESNGGGSNTEKVKLSRKERRKLMADARRKKSVDKMLQQVVEDDQQMTTASAPTEIEVSARLMQACPHALLPCTCRLRPAPYQRQLDPPVYTCQIACGMTACCVRWD